MQTVERTPSNKRALAFAVLTLTPIAEGDMARETTQGSNVSRLVIERISGEYRLVVFRKAEKDPLTIGRHRGGIRTWTQLESVVRFVEKTFPRIGAVELFLRPASEAQSSE